MITLSRVRAVLSARQPIEESEPGALRAAVAVIFLEATHGLELLFIRRAQRAGDPWSGQVAFPGGRHEPVDPDLGATAIREAREETGVNLERAERLAALDDLHPRTPTLPPVIVRPFVFALPARPALAASAEVERAFWVPLTRFGEPGVKRDVTFTVRGGDRRFPAYAVEGEIIWGMTERILTPLLALTGLL